MKLDGNLTMKNLATFGTMMIQRQLKITAVMAMILSVVAFAAMGCDGDPECKRNSDCAAGEVCERSKCVVGSGWLDSDTGSESGAVGSDTVTADSGVSTSDSGSSSETAADTASTISTATESATETDTVSAVEDTDTATATDIAADDTSTYGECLRNEHCDDSDPCTVDFCDFNAMPYICSVSPKADGASCDDGDPCNGQDLCNDGACSHSGSPCLDVIHTSGCGVQQASCNPPPADQLCTFALMTYDDGTPCMANQSPCSQGTCATGVCTSPVNPCGEGDSCSASICLPTGPTIEEYTCQPWVNDSDTSCTQP